MTYSKRVCATRRVRWTDEETIMEIGIIGAGNIGGALARRFTSVGHKVKIANSRGPATLGEIAKETGAAPVEVHDAVRDVDAIVVTIQEKNVPQLPRDLFTTVPSDVVVVDTCNYYPQQRDGRLPGIEEAPTESQWVEDTIGHKVVKAFNTIYAEHLQNLGTPKGTPERIALPVAGDDPKQKQIVMDLVDQIGFDPVDAGTIADSWRQQPGTPVYAKDFDAAGVRSALGAATHERMPEWKGPNTQTIGGEAGKNLA
jgi:8-hydroxy-5-deazaflavin:NADPH oxidoreductase